MQTDVRNSSEEYIVAAMRSCGRGASHSSLLRAFISEGIVMEWVSAQSPDLGDRITRCRGATEGNVALLAGLWELFAKHDVHLGVADKIALLESYLGND